MSKERLEEIQKEVNYAYRRDGSINTKAVTMHIEHYEYLYEQAERAQELEEWQEKAQQLHESLKRQDEVLDRLRQQNKRYREALKNIYELAEYDEYDNTLEQIVLEVEEALEDEDE